jgi:hypothetical protein
MYLSACYVMFFELITGLQYAVCSSYLKHGSCFLCISLDRFVFFNVFFIIDS